MLSVDIERILGYLFLLTGHDKYMKGALEMLVANLE